MDRAHAAAFRRWPICFVVLAVIVVSIVLSRNWFGAEEGKAAPHLVFQPRKEIDSAGYVEVQSSLRAWDPESMVDCGDSWRDAGYRLISVLDQVLREDIADYRRVPLLLKKATLLNYEGDPRRAYEVLEQMRTLVEGDDALVEEWLFTVIYYQGLTSLRLGETENCIMCRGESSCIFPIAPAALHTIPAGSRQAIKHFTEYLRQFPDDLGVRWLMNVACMTLGEAPAEPRWLLNLDNFYKSEFNIGAFRDIGHRVGLNRLNQAGGAIMEDFDNDGLLDIVVSCIDPNTPMAFFRNRGDGTFEDLTDAAGLAKQVGGMYCVQGDFDNDGCMDIFVPRGAWFQHPWRPSLLRNNGDGTFKDVTREAGLLDPVNSISAAWADYDNDGFLDLFLCCDRQPSRLYRNLGTGAFEEVSERAGIRDQVTQCKACVWLDYDNDGFPDMFLNDYRPRGRPRLFHNNRDGTFTDVTQAMGITGPEGAGFSSWAWDYDNDGWLDIFATSYFFTVDEVLKGMEGQTKDLGIGKLFRNRNGTTFEDRTKEAGVDKVYSTMGSNFGDFDNDGYLDMYLGTGSPDLGMLVPNRMLKNVAGTRFADITVSSRTGHLQKGHAVACGDWDRDGDIDIFEEMGGAVPGEKYHNVLFQNPGQGHSWLTVKLVGKKTNRAAIGVRIKAVVADPEPLTVHRHVSSGSSFGANALQQTLGLAKARRIATLEIHWPTSGTTQQFHDVAVDQAIQVTEFDKEYRTLGWTPIPLPKGQ